MHQALLLGVGLRGRQNGGAALARQREDGHALLQRMGFVFEREPVVSHQRHQALRLSVRRFDLQRLNQVLHLTGQRIKGSIGTWRTDNGKEIVLHDSSIADEGGFLF